MKKIVIIVVLNICGSYYSGAQDPVFSQFYTSSLYLNPALVGMENDLVVGTNFRSQWAGVDLPFRTFQVSAIQPIIQQGVRSKHLGGFGATLFSDEAGRNRELVSQGFSITSGYNFHLNRRGNHLIAAALQFGVIQRQINMDALQWSSQYSSVLGYDASLPGEQLVSERVTSPAIHVGAMWRLVVENRVKPMKLFYNGIAVSNINRPKGFYINEKDAPSILFKVHGGYLHTFSSGFEISPNYLVQYQKKTQVNVGAYAAYALPTVTSRSISDLKLSVGVWYRIDDSFIVTTGLSSTRWTGGFSYDANTSSLERSFQGASAFELSFAYKIRVLKSARKFSTPLI